MLVEAPIHHILNAHCVSCIPLYVMPEVLGHWVVTTSNAVHHFSHMGYFISSDKLM